MTGVEPASGGSPADLIRAMASRVERNDPDEFGGCIIIIPPPTDDGSGGEPIELLLVDPRQDLANFWSTAQSKMKIAADEFLARQSIPQLGGYR